MAANGVLQDTGLPQIEGDKKKAAPFQPIELDRNEAAVIYAF